MNIQYVGFTVTAASRTYAFRVIHSPDEIREFTVKVRSEAFRSTCLRFQDGPAICLARVKRELDGETQECRAKAHLPIAEQDIQEYLARHYPRKRS